MDRTELFRATVKTLKLRIKKQRAAVSPSESSTLPNASHKSTQFGTLAKDVAVFISKLQAFLLKHRKNYIDSARHLLGANSAMSDSERDEIDSVAQKFIQLSRDRISSLQEHLRDDDVLGEQMKQYKQGVYVSLQDYLARVTKLYSEQRAIRVKRIIERKRTSRLQPERYRRLLGSTNRTNINLNTSCGPLSIDREPSPVQPLHSTAEDGSGSVDAGSESGGDRSDSDGEEVGEDGDSGGRDTEDLSTRSSAGVRYRGRRGAGENAGLAGGSDASAVMSPPPVMAEGSGLTEEEEAEFAQENEQLFEHVNTMVDEVRQIEGKVIEISKLQELFSQHVLQQAEQIDSAFTTTVEAAENVIEGNEQIKGAIKNRASLRVWILFTLLVLSFALLFLDWYS